MKRFGFLFCFLLLCLSISSGSPKKRDYPGFSNTVVPCLNSAQFASYLDISNIYQGPQSVFAADFTNDGLQDVVVAYATSGRVVLYQNQGNYNWNAYVIASLAGASAIYASQINDDSGIDLVVASSSLNGGSVYWLKNSGSVSSWELYFIGNSSGARSVFAGDINGFGNQDVVVGGSEIKWFRNEIDNQHPNRWANLTVPYNLSSSAVDSLFVTDIDLNGYQDIVLVSSAANTVTWLNNTDGSGENFVPTPIAQPKGPVQVFCEDVNGDSYVDVVTVNADENSTTIYYNNISSTLKLDTNNSASASTVSKQWTGFYVAKGQNKPQSVFVTSINGVASVKDIVVAVTGSNYVAWYSTTSASATNWTGHVAGIITAPTYVIAGDLNGNDLNDIIVASMDARTNYVAWLQEQCMTSPSPSPQSSSHVVGWATATGVIAGFLVLWVLIATIVGAYDFFMYHLRKERELRKKELKAAELRQAETLDGAEEI